MTLTFDFDFFKFSPLIRKKISLLLLTPEEAHAIFMPPAVVSPHTTATVIQPAVNSFAAHQLNSFGSVHTQSSVVKTFLSKKGPEFLARRQHFMLQRVFKMQVL